MTEAALPAWFREGGEVMYPLLLCSVAALTFVVERAIFWCGRARRRERPRLHAVIEHLRRGELEAAAGRLQDPRDDLLKIVALGLSNGRATLRGTMEMAYAEEEKRMNRFMMVLDTVVTVAPLLGILGTVLGIIESFDILGAGRGNADPYAATGGIAKALVTTAAGLIIAIPTVIAYNVFRSKAEKSLSEIEEVATFLEVALAGGLEEARRAP